MHPCLSFGGYPSTVAQPIKKILNIPARKHIEEISEVYNIIYKMKNEKLPHMLAVQGFDIEFLPIHLTPPLDAGGLSHLRIRVLLHLPFLRIHPL